MAIYQKGVRVTTPKEDISFCLLTILNTIYTKGQNILQNSLFANAKFCHICKNPDELEKNKFSDLYYFRTSGLRVSPY
jgi:hypothetical protein